MPIPLPPTAQVVAEVIGREATLRLAGKCQYRHLYVPSSPFPADHWVTREVGERHARALQAAFRGSLLPLASCYHVHQAERDEAIRAAHASGSGITEIAETFRMSRQNVVRILDFQRAERNRRRTRHRMQELRDANPEHDRDERARRKLRPRLHPDADDQGEDTPAIGSSNRGPGAGGPKLAEGV
jgi:hypothetical protein